MVRHCVICGATLRTGRKYCHIHRSEGRYGKIKKGDDGAGMVVFATFVGIAWILWLIIKRFLGYLNEHVFLSFFLVFLIVLVVLSIIIKKFRDNKEAIVEGWKHNPYK